MKIRLVSNQDIKKAYGRKEANSKIDLGQEGNVENVEKIPMELFQILGESLSFIEKIDNMEGITNENK